MSGVVITSGTEVEDISPISITATEGSTSFTKAVKAVLIYNKGGGAVHVNFDATATTDNFEIPGNASMSLDVPFTTLHYICDSGNTSTLYVLGVR